MRSRFTALFGLVAVTSCTTFYGVEPSEGTTAATGGAASGGAGGAGGGFVAQDGFLSRFDAAHTCSVLMACPEAVRGVIDSVGVATVPLSQTARASYSACVDWLSQPLRAAHPGFDIAQPILACLATASACEGASDCLATEALDASDPACAVTPSSCVDGDWIDCANGRIAHCATTPFGVGASCYAGAGEAGCGVGLADKIERSCSGSTLFTATAAGAPRKTFDCRAIGLACNDDVTPDCAGASGVATCDMPYDVDCSADGTRARVCTSHGLRAEVACAAEGASCVQDGLSGVRCATADAACDPASADVDICNGTELRMCLRGKIVAFDCASIGAPCLGPEGNLSGRCGIP